LCRLSNIDDSEKASLEMVRILAMCCSRKIINNIRHYTRTRSCPLDPGCPPNTSSRKVESICALVYSVPCLIVGLIASQPIIWYFPYVRSLRAPSYVTRIFRHTSWCSGNQVRVQYGSGNGPRGAVGEMWVPNRTPTIS